MTDILIKNGTVIDGSGSKPVRKDVAVNEGVITEIADCIDAPAECVIDASGLIIAPGFIDIHTHSDLTLLAEPFGKSKLMQGVTTEVCGNCGLTAFPPADDERRSSLSFIDVPGLEWSWNGIESYIARQLETDTAINRIQLVGFGSLRAQVMGYENKLASSCETKRMQDLLQECFDRGLWGLSVGLGYAPDFYSDTAELKKMAETVKKNGGVFSFHVRGERDTLFKAVDEVIEIAETGVNAEISHLKCAHPSNNGRMSELIRKISCARERGLNVNFDQYPYTAGNSYLGLLFPPYVHENGIDGVIALLSDPASRNRIKREMMEGKDTWCSFLGCGEGRSSVISNAPDSCAHFLGKALSRVAEEFGTDVAEAACILFAKTEGKTEMLMFQQLDEDLENAMKQPFGLFGSDGFAMDDGEVIHKGRPHPRSFGTFPRILSHYVGEKKVLPIEEAIARMTGRTAIKIGLKDRGFIGRGYKADITVFDPVSIKDNATYDEPMKYASGLVYVIVNGVIAVDKGNITGNLPGRFLLRKDML